MGIVKNLIVSSIFLFSIILHAKPKQIRIAIIDTGIDLSTMENKPIICENGLLDFTGIGIHDSNGHGSNITDIIIGNLSNVDYCVYILKYHVSGNPYSSLKNLFKIYHWLLDNANNIDIVNFSGGGVGEDLREHLLVNKIIKKGQMLWIVAAGNEHMNLDKKCDYYPACIKNDKIIVIGNKCDNELHYSSNYGNRVNHYLCGVHVVGGGRVMTGTSQSTALFTNRLIKSLAKRRKMR